MTNRMTKRAETRDMLSAAFEQAVRQIGVVEAQRLWLEVLAANSKPPGDGRTWKHHIERAGLSGANRAIADGRSALGFGRINHSG